MLAIVPLSAYASCFLLLGNLWPKMSWDRVFLRAAVVWGVLAIGTLEILSAFGVVTQVSLSLAWFAILAGSLGALRFRRGSRPGFRFPRLSIPESRFDRALLLGVVLIVAITAFVAWQTPPQTPDSLVYHMSRVAHWAQDKAVRHFPTGIVKQNAFSPGAEMLILHFYLLAGGDRLANFVQWFAMVGSLVGASLLAKQLGGRRLAQVVTVVFVATLPMGIVQASNTMNDYVVAFWLICAAAEILAFIRGDMTPDVILTVSLAAGLAGLTKGTAAVFALPLGVMLAIAIVNRLGVVRLAVWAGVAVALVVTINFGHMFRNVRAYGHPLGPPDLTATVVNERHDARAVLSNLLRNLTLHMGTPWPSLNEWFFQAVVKIHAKMDIDLHEPQTTCCGYISVRKPTTHEGIVGNTLHAVLILIVFVGLLGVDAMRAIRRRPFNGLHLAYAAAIAFSFLLFSITFKWQVFGSRLQTPFFVLFGPVVGVGVSATLPRLPSGLISSGLIAASIPWVIGIHSRPLIPGRESDIPSILEATREEMLFINVSGVEKPYSRFVEGVEAAGCSTVGLMLSGHGAEYALWFLIGAPKTSVSLEWIVAGDFGDENAEEFRPCAVLCENCPDDWEVIRGLRRVDRLRDFSLYFAPKEDDSP